MILHPPVRGSLRAWATGNRNLILNALPAAFTSRGSLAGAIADHVPLETLQRCGKPSSSGLSIKGVFTGSDWGDTKISRIAWSRGRRLGFPVSLFCSPSASFRGRLSPRGGGGGLRRQQGESPSLLTGPGKVPVSAIPVQGRREAGSPAWGQGRLQSVFSRGRWGSGKGDVGVGGNSNRRPRAKEQIEAFCFLD